MKIALVGTAPSGEQAPFDDKSWEIWGVGTRAPYVSRLDRQFELHRLDGEGVEWATEWRSLLKEWCKGVEIMMLYPEKDLGKVTEYPHERITARFGTYFMTSSFAWMMALAIDEGATDIALYGVDMEYGTEYSHQRTGLRHFIDLAKVLGIKVSRLSSSGIAYDPVPYPMIQDDPLLQKMGLRSAVTKNNIAAYESSLKDTEQMIAALIARQEETVLADAKKYDPVERRSILADKLAGLYKTAENLRKDIVSNKGIESEQDWIRDYLVP